MILELTTDCTSLPNDVRPVHDVGVVVRSSSIGYRVSICVVRHAAGDFVAFLGVDKVDEFCVDSVSCEGSGEERCEFHDDKVWFANASGINKFEWLVSGVQETREGIETNL